MWVAVVLVFGCDFGLGVLVLCGLRVGGFGDFGGFDLDFGIWWDVCLELWVVVIS